MKNKIILASVLTATVVAVLASSKAYADNYGGTEIINKRFRIEKKVAVTDEEDWEDEKKELDYEDKVTGVEKDEIVVFKIKVKNLTDEEFDGDFDDMKTHDYLPDELERVGGIGLTEYWDDFEPGESKTLYLATKIDEDEYDVDHEFDKCVVNKVKLYWDDEFEGSDTATVCYGEYYEEVAELPETGFTSVLAVLGVVLIGTGLVIKNKKKFAK